MPPPLPPLLLLLPGLLAPLFDLRPAGEPVGLRPVAIVLPKPRGVRVLPATRMDEYLRPISRLNEAWYDSLPREGVDSSSAAEIPAAVEEVP